MTAFGVLDYIFAAIILIAVVRCVFKGFIAEVITVAALGGGILCGILFSQRGAAIIARGLGESGWNRVIAFLAIFLIVYLVLKILEGALNRLLESVNLENLDRALGFFLGIIEGILVCFALLLVLMNQPFIDVRQLIDDSLFVGYVIDLLPQAGGLEFFNAEGVRQGV